MEFGDAHLCHASEYLMSNSATPIPAVGAWLDASVLPDGATTRDGSHRFGRLTGGACQNYTTTLAAYSGTVLLPDGDPVVSSTCGTARPLACCNGEPKIVFAGFTTPTTGNLGGRPAAHAMCGAAFPGKRSFVAPIVDLPADSYRISDHRCARSPRFNDNVSSTATAIDEQ